MLSCFNIGLPVVQLWLVWCFIDIFQQSRSRPRHPGLSWIIFKQCTNPIHSPSGKLNIGVLSKVPQVLIKLLITLVLESSKPLVTFWVTLPNTACILPGNIDWRVSRSSSCKADRPSNLALRLLTHWRRRYYGTATAHERFSGYTSMSLSFEQLFHIADVQITRIECAFGLAAFHAGFLLRGHTAGVVQLHGTQSFLYFSRFKLSYLFLCVSELVRSTLTPLPLATFVTAAFW